MRICSVEGCGKKHRANGLCSTHHVAAWKAKNKERALAQDTAYRERNREKVRTSSAAYYARNKKKIYEKYGEVVRERAAQWRKDHPGAHIELKRKWAKLHPEAIRANVMNYRARKRGAEGKHSVAEVGVLFQKQNGLCAVCRCVLPRSYHKDHIMPLALGGSNWISNIQLLCPSCNRHKSAKHPEVFAKEMRV